MSFTHARFIQPDFLGRGLKAAQVELKEVTNAKCTHTRSTGPNWMVFGANWSKFETLQLNNIQEIIAKHNNYKFKNNTT